MEALREALVARPLTAEDWKPFGWLPVNDTDPHDGDHRLEFEWNDVHVNLIHHDLAEVTQTPDGLVCDVLFHHNSHTQALLVLNCRAVLAVAEASAPLGGEHILDHMRAFLVQPGDSLVLHRSTWHWGPFPVGAERVDLYNIQGLRYAEDNDSIDLGAAGRAIEVITNIAD
jgi:ureidoglycolate hydrolase